MADSIVIGISGASGAPIAAALLKALKKERVQTHLVISKGGAMTIEQETGMSAAQIGQLADVVYDNQDLGAALASGSFKTLGMAVVPCSMKTLAGIHSGYSDNLLLRAADVTLKERRRLVLVARECPLSPVHLRNMYELSQMGAVILPPVLSYYHKPETLEEMTGHVVGRIMDQLGMEYEGFRRWGG